MGEICGLFEKEEQDSGEKESTFESIMDLMQKVDKSLASHCLSHIFQQYQSVTLLHLVLL